LTKNYATNKLYYDNTIYIVRHDNPAYSFRNGRLFSSIQLLVRKNSLFSSIQLLVRKNSLH